MNNQNNAYGNEDEYGEEYDNEIIDDLMQDYLPAKLGIDEDLYDDCYIHKFEYRGYTD